MMNRAVLLEQAVAIVKDVGSLLSNRKLATAVREKGYMDFVTQVDTQVQTLICNRLFEISPQISFIGEEQENDFEKTEGVYWILDPVDGTTNLIHNFCHSTISLALVCNGDPIIGIVYDPFREELFTAIQGEGAYCNGDKLHVSSVFALKDSLCSVGTNPGMRTKADEAFQKMRKIYDRCHDIRRVGAASLELCYVAAGRLDAYFEHGLKPWDYCAGMLIVKESGGQISTFDGDNAPIFTDSCDIVATNGNIHQEVLELL